LHRFLAVFIALLTAGAQVVCACPAVAAAHQPPPAATQACTGEKECCRKAEAAKPVQPPKQAPCNQCNLKHRTEQTTPDRQAATFAPELSFFAFAAPLPILNVADISNQPQFSETLAAPALLTDLFHAHSLLLN
jgi:uncharacterized paraquat-inducible protein A